MPKTLTWIGGSNNNARNARNWSSDTAPQTGDNLVMTQGVMNVSGNDLAGDTLSVRNAEINTRAGAKLELNVSGTVDVHVHGTVVLTDLVERGDHLHISGGTIRFIGTNVFGGNGGFQGTALLEGNLIGSGTLELLGGNHDGMAMEINGSVARGLTFEVGGFQAPTEALRIDDPGKFNGLIELPPASPPFGSLFEYVAFMGLHATSADLHNDMLLMFDGKKLVDTVRLSGGSGLQLQQNSQGVMLTSGMFGSSEQPGGPGTNIPLRVS